MFAYEPRIRNPQEKLCDAALQFGDGPADSGAVISRLERQEGYDFIKPALTTLWELYSEDQGKAAVLMLLMEPEWLWYRTSNKDIFVFGVKREGDFRPCGYYETGRNETGEVIVHQMEDVDLKEQITDPRGAYEARVVKTRIFKDKGKFWGVKVGRVVDLVKAGYSRDDVELTGGKGYLKKFPAYVIFSQSYSDLELAKQELY
jgi:hypothetical protein